MFANLAKIVLERGGRIRPLLIDSKLTNGTGICNPSIFIDGEDILVNLRHVEYNLFHAEFGKKFESRWGPMTYMHPEDDLHLRTNNYLAKLTPDLDIESIKPVNTLALDVTPLWDFVGLEDARVVRWNDTLFITGVRRDTTPNGVGRMELSEIRQEKGEVLEVARTRIEPPDDPTSYCEKNWMPVVDLPFHYVKWSNPTEVVKVDLATKSSIVVARSNNKIEGIRDIRGGSQIIPWKDYRIAITHEVDLWFNEPGNKDCHYYHRVIVWDKDWNIVKVSSDFKFMDGSVEFSCGLAAHGDNLLATFGYHDNAAFVLEIPNKVFEEFLDEHPVTASN